MYNPYNISHIVRGRIGGRERERKREGETNNLMSIDSCLKKGKKMMKRDREKRVILRID